MTLTGIQIRSDLAQTTVQVQAAPVETTISSLPSIAVRHSTIFENFGFNATATYNFYTADEKIVRELDPLIPLNELPRYVMLSWRRAPDLNNLSLGTKAAPPFKPRPALPSIATVSGLLANGFISPGAITTSVSIPLAQPIIKSFDEDAFLNDKSTAGLTAAQVKTTFKQSVVASQNVGITFVDPSIAGALNETRLTTIQKQSEISVSAALMKLLGSLEVISEFNQDLEAVGAPTEPAPEDSPKLAYLGYMIERYKHENDGSMSLSATFNIDDISSIRFVDRSVAYGESYSYRIRTVLQWTRRSGIDFNETKSNTVQQNRVSSFIAGDWSPWVEVTIADLVVPDPPDELTIVPYSNKKVIRVCWKLSNNSQRDLKRFFLLRAKLVGDSMSEWTQLGDFAPSNGFYEDHVDSFIDRDNTRYVYTMYATTLHDEISTLSEQVACGLVDRFFGREQPLKQISARGVKVGTTGYGSRIPEIINRTELIAKSRALISSRAVSSQSRLDIRSYLVLVRSLFTGECVPVTINVIATDFQSPPLPRGRIIS